MFHICFIYFRYFFCQLLINLYFLTIKNTTNRIRRKGKLVCQLSNGFPFVVLLSNLGISLYVKISGTRFFAPRFFSFLRIRECRLIPPTNTFGFPPAHFPVLLLGQKSQNILRGHHHPKNIDFRTFVFCFKILCDYNNGDCFIRKVSKLV